MIFLNITHQLEKKTMENQKQALILDIDSEIRLKPKPDYRLID